ncbi:aminotransferase class I/II-fold pyridoxal phosphate-dependent enzyme [Weissella ceti]|uniref:Aminotransferase n=1 Tax=Weissella ceti TaxID=759620 RepID=A0ABT3E604_9LACO|nr:aminotransferase class I/II-fold pyridoxal phosphate-dependent enzyme [Weissella ceti]MCW0953832.1 aminotransferase class I/II-fold pyridoxal phosphate-dependent enzyme [Weissella ceti]QVK11671.1 aminotransferase class I/II-fold pyridoxal phosphate-dependent enzyme [Weissella ceti]
MTSHFNQLLNPIVTNLAPDGLTEFQRTIRDIPDIVQLTFGEPGFNADARIKQAVKASVDADNSHYTDPSGEETLRDKFREYINTKYKTHYGNVSNVMVTAGVSEGINVVFMTMLAAGEGILIPDPAYPPYFAALKLAYAEAITINTRASDFKITPEQVEEAIEQASIPVKAILFNYPTNPTGVTYSRDELIALANVFEKHQLWVISDEIYSQLTYDQEHTSMAELLPSQTVMITGLSKSHALTGYRLGFILADDLFMKQAKKVHDTLMFSLPKVIQDGALVAITEADDIVAEMRQVYQRRRDWLLPHLEDMGFSVISPQGAFYMFAKIPADIGHDGYDFALSLAQEGKVGVIPGSAFSETTKDYIRISYAVSDEDLERAVTRMKKFLQDKRSQ